MEMFIVSSGAVQVVGGPGDSIVFVTLGQGVCFGEIALLGTGGMNRRTASIKVTQSHWIETVDLSIMTTPGPWLHHAVRSV